MKARVCKVFKNSRYQIDYIYVNTAKCRDDVEAWDKGSFRPPMMEVTIFKENEDIIEGKFEVFASPELIKEYTGFNMFYSNYDFEISSRYYIIECEWVEGEYPYLYLYDSKDYTKTERYKYLKIFSIKDDGAPYVW